MHCDGNENYEDLSMSLERVTERRRGQQSVSRTRHTIAGAVVRQQSEHGNLRRGQRNEGISKKIQIDLVRLFLNPLPSCRVRSTRREMLHRHGVVP